MVLLNRTGKVKSVTACNGPRFFHYLKNDKVINDMSTFGLEVSRLPVEGLLQFASKTHTV